MKRALISVALALVMTVPFGIGIAWFPGVWEWIHSTEGHKFFEPLFKTFDAYGFEQQSEVVAATVYLLGFVVSLVFVIAFWTMVGRPRRNDWREKR
jgi:hypothetical protein